MKVRPLVPTLVASLALAFMAIAVACGDDDEEPSPGGNGELSLEEYFQALDAAQAASQEVQVQQAEPVLEDPEATLEDKKEAFREFFTGFSASLRVYFEGLEALDPPAEVEDAHNDFLAALRGWMEAAEDIRDNKIDVVQSDTEFQPLLDKMFGPGGAGAPLGPACESLKRVAEDNNIEVPPPLRDCG